MVRRDRNRAQQSNVAIALEPAAGGKRVVFERQQEIGEVLPRAVER
jgi:hypothetical protein